MVSARAYSGLMTGFTKLFSSIVHSTVWREDMHVKVVWITMLAMADRNGDVQASLPGLADAARVSIPQTEEALARLSSPDPYSRTKEHEGRRIAPVDGGWVILNYMKYREMRSKDERRIQTREAVRRLREKKKADSLTVSHGKPKQKQKQSTEEEEIQNTSSPSGDHRGGINGQIVQAYIDARHEDDPKVVVLAEKKHFIRMAEMVKAGLTLEDGVRLARRFALSPPRHLVDKNQTGIDYLVMGIKDMQELERNSRR